MMVRIANYRIFRGRYLIMRDDLSGLDSRGCWRLCHITGGARLRIARIVKSDANNLNFSDESDTSGPWHPDIAIASSKRSLMPSRIVFR
jgi:hypothetical protein